ncbi:MAG: hypothetical protein ACI8XG_000503 [Congregibacter sp.]
MKDVKVDAGTAGSCDNSGQSCSLIASSGSWSIEALSQTSFDFGTDDNNAHAQLTGDYYYHGMPEGFVTKQGGNSSTLNFVDDGVYMVLSVAVSAFEGTNDDRGGKLSKGELTRHQAAIARSVKDKVALSNANGNLF